MDAAKYSKNALLRELENALKLLQKREDDLKVAGLAIAHHLEGGDISKPIDIETLRKAPLHALRGDQVEVEGVKCFRFYLAIKVGDTIELDEK